MYNHRHRRRHHHITITITGNIHWACAHELMMRIAIHFIRLRVVWIVEHFGRMRLFAIRIERFGKQKYSHQTTIEILFGMILVEITFGQWYLTIGTHTHLHICWFSLFLTSLWFLSTAMQWYYYKVRAYFATDVRLRILYFFWWLNEVRPTLIGCQIEEMKNTKLIYDWKIFQEKIKDLAILNWRWQIFIKLPEDCSSEWPWAKF